MIGYDINFCGGLGMSGPHRCPTAVDLQARFVPMAANILGVGITLCSCRLVPSLFLAFYCCMREPGKTSHNYCTKALAHLTRSLSSKLASYNITSELAAAFSRM